MQIRVHHQFMILERRSCMIKELSLASIPSAADMYGLERKPKTFNSQNDIRKEIPEIYVLSVFFSVSCMNTQGIFFFFLCIYRTAKSVANGAPPSCPTPLPPSM